MIRIHRESNKKKKVPLFAGMSIVEKFAMITLPCGLGFIIWTMCDIWDLVWWIRLIISVCGVLGLIGLIILIVNLFHTEY